MSPSRRVATVYSSGMGTPDDPKDVPGDDPANLPDPDTIVDPLGPAAPYDPGKPGDSPC